MEPAAVSPSPADIEARLALRLRELLLHALALERQHAEQIAAVAPSMRASARNLVHYLGLRQHDIRALQSQLLACGLSSLSNSEAHTLASLQATLARLDPGFAATSGSRPVDFRSGPLLLADHARHLLGPSRAHRSTRIMVTMPAEAAGDPALVRDLLLAGMDVMRINCAHDEPRAWHAMARHLREAMAATGLHCRIQADLAGPKLRTGPIAPQGKVLHLKPQRNPLGEVTAPARFALVEYLPGQTANTGSIGIDAELLHEARDGDQLELCDLRGKPRTLALRRQECGGFHAECCKGLYLGPRTAVRLLRGGKPVAQGRLGEVPEVSLPITLRTGDTLVLTREDTAGANALRDESGIVLVPAHVHCTLAEVFGQVRHGEQVWLDDGKIGGVIGGCTRDTITVRITHASPRGSKLGAEKGINFPDTALLVPVLSAKDLEDLAEVAPFADLVGLSFLRRAEDVLALQSALAHLDTRDRGIVLKIENREAFENLPEILLASLRAPPVGVMVARGDLAVEVGFERLSEVQEEILQLCEAAHVPVVWATQMLEGLAKKGVPSRAEVTDAAASGRAECAMLNKGANIVGTTRFLSDVLERMATHQAKRRPALRRLAVTSGF